MDKKGITKEQVRLYMEENELTYQAMADKFKIGVDTVVRWRRNGISPARVNTASAIVAVSAFYGEAGNVAST